ncbi:DUF6000 family protein [Streptomyces scopuliridis]|uniref:DUF6000 family protein n=1 Tax=Streptomyces scopuliridis TaxID=452529 RepID=UPI0036BE864D
MPGFSHRGPRPTARRRLVRRPAPAWLISVGRRVTFRARIGDLLLASEFCFSGGDYCFALARFGTHADAENLASYFDHHFPLTDLRTTRPTPSTPSSTSTPPRHRLRRPLHPARPPPGPVVHPHLRPGRPMLLDRRALPLHERLAPPVILSFSMPLSRLWSTLVIPRNRRGTTGNERGNGQHHRTPILPARVVPDSLSDAKRNGAVTAGVRRRVSCRPLIVG